MIGKFKVKKYWVENKLIVRIMIRSGEWIWVGDLKKMISENVFWRVRGEKGIDKIR